MSLTEGTYYEEVYGRFAQKITDFSLYELLQSKDAEVQKFVEKMLHGYLISAVSKFYKCTSDLSDRDEVIKKFNTVLSDLDIEILSLLMVVEWISPQLNSTEYTLQFIGGKNQKFYAQSNQLMQLQALENNSRLKAKKLISNYTYLTSKSKLGGG